MGQIKLYPTNHTGKYARDEEGNPWAIFTTAGWVTCAQCGKHITSGWVKGKLGKETFYCSEHVETEDKKMEVP